MGILKLMDFIKAKFPSVITFKPISLYQHQVLAIDTSNWIYQFLIKTQSIKNKNISTPTDWMGNQTGHLIGMLARVKMCLQHKITPVWVFDGKPPQEKFDELQRRKSKRQTAEEKSEQARQQGEMFNLLKMTQRTVKITQRQKQDAMKLINLIGLPVIQAPSQAQPQCAWLVKNGLAYGTVSEDLDTLTFGSDRLIRSFSKREDCVQICLEKLLSESKLTYQQFIDMCILCGCDYSSRISKIGPINAYNLLLKHGNIEKIIEYIMNNQKLRDRHTISDDFNYLRARKLFREPQVMEVKKQHLKINQINYEGLTDFLLERDFSQNRIQKWIQDVQKLQHP